MVSFKEFTILGSRKCLNMWDNVSAFFYSFTRSTKFKNALGLNFALDPTRYLKTECYMNNYLKYLIVCCFTLFTIVNVNGQDTLSTEHIDMSNCIPLYSSQGTVVITSRAALDSLVRKDGSKERCLELLKEYEMDSCSLLGIHLSTGWCKVPQGLQFTATKIDAEKKYILTVQYNTPIEPCRALSRYNLWVKVPALPVGYEVEFVVEPKGWFQE